MTLQAHPREESSVAGRGGRPPGPHGRRVLYGRMNEIDKDPLGLLLRLQRDYGGVNWYRAAFWNVCNISEPAAIKHVLVDNVRNYNKDAIDYKMLKAIMGEGLLTSDGDFWRRQRRMIQPIFHNKRINAYGALMVEEAEAMLARWQSVGSGETLDISQEMMRLTLQIAGRALFSLDLLQEAKAVGSAVSVVAERLGKPSLSNVFFRWVPTTNNLRYHRAKRTLDGVVHGILQKRRKQLAQGKSTSDAEELPQDLLTLLLQAQDEDSGEGMGDQQILDEVMTLLLAGHETTANAMSWTFALLSQHPNARATLEAELETVLAGRAPQIEDLGQLNYTRMVIEEAMRLYPPVWAMTRNTVADDEILGYHIPAGTLIVLTPYAAQRNPRYWKDPDAFDPTRFSPEASADRPRYAYFPFGAGQRACIGKHFALTEMTLLLATIAQQLRLDLPKGHILKPEPLVTLRPYGGAPMTPSPRA